jgi:hypothetical protein
MSLSDFAYDILRVLDRAGDCMSTAEIANTLSEEEYSIVTGRVRPYLEHALEKYVERRPEDRWKIASPHHGKFSSAKRPTGDDETDSSSAQTDSQEKGQDELSRAIVQILADADAPLPSSRIARIAERSDSISSSEIEFIETLVNRRLHYGLSAVVEKDDDHRWRLVDRAYDETSGAVETAEEKDSEASQGQKNSRGDGGKTSEEKNAGPRSRHNRKTADNDSDQSSKKEDQESSSDRKASRKAQGESEVSLSDFEREILTVVAGEEGYFRTEEIAEALQQKHGRDSELGRVQFYLENALDEYVVRKSSKGWNIASPYRGEFFSSKDEALNNEASSDPSEEIGGKVGLDSVDKLSELVIQELSEADSSLKARRIAERISEDSNDISLSRTNRIRTEVNRRLYGELSAHVKKDDEHRWTLNESARKKRPTSGSEKSQADDVSEGEDKTSDEPLAERENDGASRHESEHDSEKTTPSGIAAEVQRRLETGRQAAFLLDLVDTPLSVSKLTSLIEARGQEIKEEEIRQCLESTLSRFVTDESGGYRLRGDIERTFETEADGTSPVEETEESDAEQKPIDAATRASVSGHRYEYVFKSQEMEGSSLFSSQIRGGTVTIKLNASHKAFDHFSHILDGESNLKAGEARGQYKRLLRLLLVAWTEVEGDLSGRRGELAEEIRNDWGRALRFLLQKRDEG